MSLRSALNLVLEEYPAQSQSAFTGNELASFIRNEIPGLIRAVVDDERYYVRGSAGQGNWARCPWIAVFDRLVTDTAQEGYYIVYLVREDFAGIYLSLNQGVTDVREKYGSDAREALSIRSADYAAQLGDLTRGTTTGPIDLAAASSGLGAYYEVGNIAALYYESGSLPQDQELASDLERFIELYSTLVDKEVTIQNDQTVEDDEEDLVEDLSSLRLHKRVERNRKLSRLAKEAHGFSCQACHFDFERHYGVLGIGFIEAHHLTPLADLRGQRIALDPKKDFAVLCANCHRMIHRSKQIGDVRAFSKVHLRKR